MSSNNSAALHGMLQWPLEVMLLMQAMTEVRFSVPVGELREEQRAEAEQKAREAFVLSLLRQGQISTHPLPHVFPDTGEAQSMRCDLPRPAGALGPASRSRRSVDDPGDVLHHSEIGHHRRMLE